MTVVVDVFRVIAACTSTVMLLSPIPTIYKVYTTKTTGVASIVPIVSMFANSHISIFYGYLSKHYFPIFSTFVVGDILCLIYIAIFYRYSHEKPKVHRVFLLFGIPLTLVTVYAFLGGFGVAGQTRHTTGNVVGYIGVVATLVLYSSPFERIGHVLRHRSAVFLNIHMVCAGTFNNAVWATYTTLSRQWIILTPNIFCLCMGCIQISLYFIFHPSTHPYELPPNGATQGENACDLEDGLPRDAVDTKHKELDDTSANSSFVPLVSPLTETMVAHK